MAKKDPRNPELRIKYLEAEIAAKDQELTAIKAELHKINHQLETFFEQIDGELKLAAHIQKSLVPTEIPSIPGFEFSTKFVPSMVAGGDYFDIFELEDKMRFGVILASSSGHGMASLFMSVLLKLTSRIEAKKGMAPDEVLKHLAQEIHGGLKGDSEQVHLFYGIIDRRDYRLSYSTAGDVPAYLFKYAEDKLVNLDIKQPALVGVASKTFKTESINLDPRDRLVVLSRGFLAVESKTQSKLSKEALCDVILENIHGTPHGMRNEILFQAQKFAQGSDYPMDLSVLILRVKDRVIKLNKA